MAYCIYENAWKTSAKPCIYTVDEYIFVRKVKKHERDICLVQYMSIQCQIQLGLIYNHLRSQQATILMSLTVPQADCWSDSITIMTSATSSAPTPLNGV